MTKYARDWLKQTREFIADVGVDGGDAQTGLGAAAVVVERLLTEVKRLNSKRLEQTAKIERLTAQRDLLILRLVERWGGMNLRIAKLDGFSFDYYRLVVTDPPAVVDKNLEWHVEEITEEEWLEPLAPSP